MFLAPYYIGVWSSATISDEAEETPKDTPKLRVRQTRGILALVFSPPPQKPRNLSVMPCDLAHVLSFQTASGAELGRQVAREAVGEEVLGWRGEGVMIVSHIIQPGCVNG